MLPFFCSTIHRHLASLPTPPSPSPCCCLFPCHHLLLFPLSATIPQFNRCLAAQLTTSPCSIHLHRCLNPKPSSCHLFHHNRSPSSLSELHRLLPFPILNARDLLHPPLHAMPSTSLHLLHSMLPPPTIFLPIAMAVTQASLPFFPFLSSSPSFCRIFGHRLITFYFPSPPPSAHVCPSQRSTSPDVSPSAIALLVIAISSLIPPLFIAQHHPSILPSPPCCCHPLPVLPSPSQSFLPLNSEMCHAIALLPDLPPELHATALHQGYPQPVTYSVGLGVLIN